MGTVFVKLLDSLVVSLLNHDRVADLVEVQLSSSGSDSLIVVFPVMFTSKGAIVMAQKLMAWCSGLTSFPAAAPPSFSVLHAEKHFC